MTNITRKAIFALTLIMVFTVFVPVALGAEEDSFDNSLQDKFLQIQKLLENLDYNRNQEVTEVSTPEDSSTEEEALVIPVNETPQNDESDKDITEEVIPEEIATEEPIEKEISVEEEIPIEKETPVEKETFQEEVNENQLDSLSPSQPTAEEIQMAEMINKERIANGLEPLNLNEKLVTSARMKSQDMINNNYFGHYGGEYGSPYTLIREAEPNYNAAGENLAGNSSVEKAHEALMNSSSHKANILSENYTDVGIGIVDGGPYGKMITQHFVGK